VESLRERADQNLSSRRKEVVKAKILLEEKLEEFLVIYRERENENVFLHIPAEIKSIKQHAKNVVFKKDMEELDEDTKDLFERMLDYMERRCISVPMIAAKGLHSTTPTAAAPRDTAPVSQASCK
ncbi:MAG: hypothetical protein AB8F74_07630, partial [Saprospiraceae bacterium]